MATKSKQQPSQGGGRTANAEPRIQDFKAFQGINIELSPLGDYNYSNPTSSDRTEQTDLQQTFFSVLDNAEIKSNGSIEVREPWIKLPALPRFALSLTQYKTYFRGPVLQVGRRIFAATVPEDYGSKPLGISPYGGLMYYDIPDDPTQVSSWHACKFNGGETITKTYSGSGNSISIDVYPSEVVGSYTRIVPKNFSSSKTVDRYVWYKNGTQITDTKVAHGAKGLDVYVASTSDTYGLRIYFTDSTYWEPVNNLSVISDDPTKLAFPLVDDICYADDKLVITDGQTNHMWTCDNITDTYPVFTEARLVTNPGTLASSRFTPKNMTMSTTYSTTTPYKVTFAYQYVTQFGPCPVSGGRTLYFSKPVSEWNETYCVTIVQPWDSAPVGVRLIKAVEVFYKVDTASEYNFAFRTGIDLDDATNFWSYTWCGYLQDPKSWTVANLQPNDDGNNLSRGPAIKYLDFIDGRFWFWHMYDKPYRIYAGGNPGNLLSVASTTGGGFIDVDPGTGNQVMLVTKYKTQSGNNIITCLCDNPNTHREQRYNLVETSVSLSNEQTQHTWQAEQVAGCVGTSSRWGAIVAEDGIYSMSRYGLALTTMTMEYNSQLRTQYVSDPIKPLFTTRSGETLKASSIECIDGVLYVAFGKNPDAISNKYPDVIFCYDIAKKVWWSMHDWDIEYGNSVINTFHLDYEEGCEGLGIVFQDNIFMLPTAHRSDHEIDKPETFAQIKTANIGTTQPLQNWHRLTQLQFDFDYIYGNINFVVEYLDRYGRIQRVESGVSTINDEDNYDTWYDYSHFIRIDADVRSYTIQILIDGKLRLTHFMSKIYAQTKRYNMPLGFDSSMVDLGNNGSVKTERRAFKNYDDYMAYINETRIHKRVQIT